MESLHIVLVRGTQPLSFRAMACADGPVGFAVAESAAQVWHLPRTSPEFIYRSGVMDLFNLQHKSRDSPSSNSLNLRPEAQVLAQHEDNPLLVLGCC